LGERLIAHIAVVVGIVAGVGTAAVVAAGTVVVVGTPALVVVGTPALVVVDNRPLGCIVVGKT